MSSHAPRRPRLGIGLLSLLALLGLTFTAATNVAAQQASTSTSATTGVIGEATNTTACGTNPTTPKTDGGTAYKIDSSASTASYKAHEELQGKGFNEAVGTTNAFIGTIVLDKSSAPVACSRFDVDLRTLQSDSSRRDNYLYRNTLETEQYPLATFILTKVEGLNGAMPQGKETNVTLIGNLSVHGVTKQVAWAGKVKLAGSTMTGSATTTFKMEQFDITPPKAGPVISINDTLTLEVQLTAKKAS
jgi:polyisoprenoid-binding protein YceI